MPDNDEMCLDQENFGVDVLTPRFAVERPVIANWQTSKRDRFWEVESSDAKATSSATFTQSEPQSMEAEASDAPPPQGAATEMEVSSGSAPVVSTDPVIA